MGIINEEYGRFIQWLSRKQISPDAIRVTNIVLANLEEISQTVGAAGQRARLITNLLRSKLPSQDDQIGNYDHAVEANQLPWNRLERLEIGPFRGFRREERFDLNKQVVLFYGPNGSGKTSLCEAIEFSLLGHVEEAYAKRIEPLQNYFDNIYEKTHVQPRLLSSGNDGGIPVTPNEELLRFAIIEKNRIEGFARLAARSPAQANTLIATLFGLDSFNDFVNNFTSLEGQLNISATPKKDDLVKKRSALEAARKNIDNNDEVEKAFEAEETLIANNFEQEITYNKLLELLGTDEQPGRLAEINKLLESPARNKIDIKKSHLIAIRRLVNSKLVELENHTKLLKERGSEISYRDLYRAIQELEKEISNVCPACDTPLDRVVSNPFSKAANGLVALNSLAELEEKVEVTKEECVLISNKLARNISLLSINGVYEGHLLKPIFEWATSDQRMPIWQSNLITKVVWKELLMLSRKAEKEDARIQNELVLREKLIKERNRLEKSKERILELNGKRAQYLEQLKSDNESIAKFDVDNKELIEAVEKEEEQRRLDVRILVAYQEFIELLKQYKEDLPQNLLADLNDTTRDLYNSINIDDHDNDKLANLTLPMRGGERILISFRGSPKESHDALLVLSEGHLRCLGLAILLAKNIKLELPMILFDDAVNAIDHDHRAGIRSTLFGDPRLKNKQILMTSHSNEFIKDIQNQLGENSTKLYVFNHHSGDHQPIVQNGSDRHYLSRARERLNEGDQRQCLASCRQALENLSWRIWKNLHNRYSELAALPLVLRSPVSKPELRGLIESLAKKITQGTEQGILKGESWDNRKEGLNEILAVPERHLIWTYFNKGVHDEEDREDFEIQVVRNMVDALTKISATFNN